MAHKNGNGRAQLFEVCVVHHPKPTKDEHERNITPKSSLIRLGDGEHKHEMLRMLADDEGQVAIHVARDLPQEYLDRLNEVDIIIRPFVEVG